MVRTWFVKLSSSVSKHGDNNKKSKTNSEDVFTIPPPSLKALKKISDNLPLLLTKYFLQRAQEINAQINTITVYDDKADEHDIALTAIRSNLNKLEEDWHSIIDKIDNPKEFCKAVEDYVLGNQLDAGNPNSIGLSDKKVTLSFVEKPALNTYLEDNSEKLMQEISRLKKKF